MPAPDARQANAPTNRGVSSAELGGRLHANSSPFDLFVQQLTQVNGRPPYVRGQQLRADCPLGHSSRMTLWAIEGESGSVGFYCHACGDSDKQAILSALGLKFSDLYPQRLSDSTPEGRRGFRQRMREAAIATAWNALASEVAIVRIVAGDVLRLEVSREDLERCALAEARINDAVRVINGR